jgi:hypothetical protein
MLYRAYQFDGLTLPTNYGGSGSWDIGPGEVVTDYVTLVGGRVWDAYRTDRKRPGLVKFGLQCGINAANAAAVKTAYDALAAKVGVKGTLVRIDAASATQSLTARMTGLTVVGQPQWGLHWQPIQVTFETENLPWYGTARNGGPVTITGGEGNQTITNSGSAPYFTPTLTLTAGNNSVTAFAFIATSGVRHWHWAWAGTLAATKALVINCGSKQITNDGTANYGLTLDASHNQNEWAEVPNGNLTFAVTVTHSGTDPTLSWTSYDGWL